MQGRHLEISKVEAWKRVIEENDFRGLSPTQMRAIVTAVTEGLKKPRHSLLACQYPDCECVGRCRTTGRMLEPGDWP